MRVYEALALIIIGSLILKGAGPRVGWQIAHGLQGLNFEWLYSAQGSIGLGFRTLVTGE